MTLRILAVEDRKSTTLRLEEAFKGVMGNVDICSALSTEGAKRLLSGNSFEIIIVGGFLPEEDGGRTESGAGLNFLEFLNEACVGSLVIFYAGNSFDVSLAANKLVSGRPVHAYLKKWQSGSRSRWHHKEVQCANPDELASHCKRFLEEGCHDPGQQSA